MLPNTAYASCPLCYGSRTVSDGPCTSCADPDPVRARKVLEQLTPDQMAFLRAYGHTLAKQPLTLAEHNSHQCEYFVEEWDGQFDEDAEIWIIPNTRHWFASGEMRFGPCGEGYFIRYNPLGLLLRDCLMYGADAVVPHSLSADVQALVAARDRDGAEGGDANAAPSPKARQARAEGIAQ